jgi:ubiquinol-cytochrome c reductase cytochrome c subunit
MKLIRHSWRDGVVVLIFAFLVGGACTSITNARQESKSPDSPSGNAENGKQLFVKDGCYQCHGREGQGSTMSGPRIAPDPIPFDALLAYARKPRGEMPPYTAKVISDKDLADIYAYLESRPHPPTAKASALLK